MTDAIERLRARTAGATPLDAIMQPKAPVQGDVLQIPGGKLHDNAGHTFKLRPGSDPYMVSLLTSIKECGILEPLLVRPHPRLDGEYEIIAGHTRHTLGQQAGLVTFPCVVRDLSDLDSIIQMGESNVQRPDWLPSEKAATYKAHLDALRQKRQFGVEPSSTLEGKTRDLAAERWGITGKMLEMYVQLAELHSGLLDMVDEGRIPVKAGYQLSFLASERQEALLQYLRENSTVKVSCSAAEQLRLAPMEDIPAILAPRPAKRPVWKLSLPRELVSEEQAAYLGDPELQARIAKAIEEYAAERGG